MFNIYASVGCHIGKKRSNNEDNFYLNGQFKEDPNEKKNLFLNTSSNDKIQIYAVCDGMGGESLGEMASYIAVKTLAKYQREVFTFCNKTTLQKSIEEYIDDVNEQICEIAIKLDKKCVGTTLALIAIYEDYMYVYNLGDSKIYFISKDEIVQLSKDHTKAQMLYDAGLIDKDELKNSHSKNVLTQHLGVFKNDIKISPSKVLFRLNKGDKFMICSDGVTDLLNEDEIEKIIRDSSNTSDIAHKIVDNSLLKGGIDNITNVVISVDEKKRDKTKSDKMKYLLFVAFLIVIILGIILLI
ncbi:PP2C family protein-serine/threonine phosphatase [Intestinibacter sp.]